MSRGILILSFLLISQMGFSKNQDHLSYKEALQESARAIVRKERSRALKILSQALENFDGKPKEKVQLETALRRAGELFISDRGQSLYESARNLYLANPQEALAKLMEALEIEGENTQILWTITKTHLKVGQCAKARDTFSQLNVSTQKGHGNFSLLYAYCLGQGFDQVIAEKLTPREKTFSQGLLFFEKEQYEAAESSFVELVKMDPDFVETYYWIWKVNPKKSDSALRYKKLCATDLFKLAKAYPEFPQLCKYRDQVIVSEDENGY